VLFRALLLLLCRQQNYGLSDHFLDSLDYGREVGISMGWDDKLLGLLESLPLRNFLIVAQVARILAGA
jgi:hypothetical protein